uniref:Uncharacterized protein n=1 Tax=Picea sitchensis TaxID=3332 RepID=A9NQT8_PICSI|nr:unknown [Picea sitchensis]
MEIQLCVRMSARKHMYTHFLRNYQEMYSLQPAQK